MKRHGGAGSLRRRCCWRRPGWWGPGRAPVARAGSTCLGAPVTIIGSEGSDAITGTSGPDVIHGQGGDDVIDGGGGDDRICGGSGADTIRAAAAATAATAAPTATSPAAARRHNRFPDGDS